METPYNTFFVATILLALSSISMANYPPATTFVIDNCVNTPDSTLCLQTLIPNVARVDQDNKKLTRLALAATIDAAQSTGTAIDNLSKQPQLWTREVQSLQNCSSLIQVAKASLSDLDVDTYHLGGGNKNDKETVRLKMLQDVRSVNDAHSGCMADLQAGRARGVITSRVESAFDLLVRQANNVYYIIEHFEF